MTSVVINGMSVPLGNASEGWINQMISDARRNGRPLCIQVSVTEPGAQVGLATPDCGRGGPGGRPPNELERRIIDAWQRRGLGNGHVSPGELHAFLNELRRLI